MCILIDDSFVLAFSSAILITEWHFAANFGMVGVPAEQKVPIPSKEGKVIEP